MTQAESKRIEEHVRDGLRQIGLTADLNILPSDSFQATERQQINFVEYRTTLGNTTIAGQ